MLDRSLRRGLPRLMRGGFVALMTMTLSVGAHVYAGGRAPTAASMIAITGGYAAFCWVLSARRWTLRPLLAVFLLAQVATHCVAMIEHPEHSMGGVAMLPAHVVAALLLVAMVTYGETALARLVAHLALRCLGLRVVPAPEHAVVAVPSPVVSRLAGLFVQTVRGRAPPRERLLPAF